MYKIDSFADEIYRSMEKTLVKKQSEDVYGFSKLAKAVDFLNAAAMLFEQAQMYEEAAEVTNVLQKLADQLASSKTSSFEGK